MQVLTWRAGGRCGPPAGARTCACSPQTPSAGAAGCTCAPRQRPHTHRCWNFAALGGALGQTRTKRRRAAPTSGGAHALLAEPARLAVDVQALRAHGVVAQPARGAAGAARGERRTAGADAAGGTLLRERGSRGAGSRRACLLRMLYGRSCVVLQPCTWHRTARCELEAPGGRPRLLPPPSPPAGALPPGASCGCSAWRRARQARRVRRRARLGRKEQGGADERRARAWRNPTLRRRNGSRAARRARTSALARGAAPASPAASSSGLAASAALPSMSPRLHQCAGTPGRLRRATRGTRRSGARAARCGTRDVERSADGDNAWPDPNRTASQSYDAIHTRARKRVRLRPWRRCCAERRRKHHGDTAARHLLICSRRRESSHAAGHQRRFAGRGAASPACCIHAARRCELKAAPQPGSCPEHHHVRKDVAGSRGWRISGTPGACVM